jgi:hypothetical protein
VLHLGLLDYDGNGCLAVPDVARPISIPERRQAARNRFVEAFSRDLDGVPDALDIMTGDSTRAKRHVELM